MAIKADFTWTKFQVPSALQKLVKEEKNKKRRALMAAGAIVMREAVKNAPSDTGNLRASQYINPPDGDHIEFGFSAAYALYVHEIDKNYTVGDWKYLERSMNENKDKLLQLFRQTYHHG